jgi:ubiquinone/menaquinone biosynthesis C-methylase UbiE
MSNAVAGKSTNEVTPERIMQFAWGHAFPLSIEAAVKNKVFDVLDSGARTLQELSSATGASERGLRAICNALVSVQLLAKKGERYELTPESAAFLVSTKPGFQGGLFKHISKQLMPKWLELTEIVRSGRPAHAVNQENVGSKFFEDFVEDIFPMSYAAAQALGDALKLKDATGPVSVLDLAAGSGVWGIALAQKSKQVRVRAVDWPGVLPVTRRVVERFKLSDRFTFVEGDLQTADFGSGHQVATLGHILHSEGERKSRQLLRRTFAALAPGGTIAIAEFLAGEGRTGPVNSMIFAINMLVNTDEGNTFTFNEIAGWLKEAGFSDVRQLEAPGPSPMTLATKPK